MMSWFDFMNAVKGYSFYMGNKKISKAALYDMIKDRSDFMDIINGKSTYIERRDSPGWRNGKCYFYWDIAPNGKAIMRRTNTPQ